MGGQSSFHELKSVPVLPQQPTMTSIHSFDHDHLIAIRTRVRDIVREHARLPVDVDDMEDTDDLYQAGLTSHASVNLMLALEDAFEVEFPDALLLRRTFESVAAIADALSRISTNAG